MNDAVDRLLEHQIGALVVSENGRTVLGIVSERDIVRRLASRREALLGDTVESIMTPVVHTCGVDDDTDQLRSTMTEYRIRHVPVIEAGVLAGIVSIGDVVKNSIDELTKDRDVLVDYISAR